MPRAVAPDIMGWAQNDSSSHCIWKRQPETQQEIENAIKVVLVSEVACHRYSGDDEQVIARLGREYCDSTAGASIFERIIDAVRTLLRR